MSIANLGKSCSDISPTCTRKKPFCWKI